MLSAALLIAGKATAQVGVHAGYSPETWAIGDNNVEFTTIFAGVDYNMPISGGLNVMLGGQLRYSTESKASNVLGVASGSHTTTLLGIDIPVLLNYGINLSGDLGLTLFAGPKVSFALSGVTKREGNVLGVSASTETEWFDEDGYNYNPLDLSVTLGLAFTYQQFRLFGGYNYGLLDRDNNSNAETKVSGLFFGAGIGL